MSPMTSPIYQAAPTMKPGLYQVTTPYLCAGFVLEAGRLTQCAPILRAKIEHWKRVAVWVGE